MSAVASQFALPRGTLGRAAGMLMARTNRNLYQRAIELLELSADDRVLEIGYGPGAGIERVAGIVTSGHVIGTSRIGTVAVVGQNANDEIGSSHG